VGGVMPVGGAAMPVPHRYFGALGRHTGFLRVLGGRRLFAGLFFFRRPLKSRPVGGRVLFFDPVRGADRQNSLLILSVRGADG
jgi:hypothetical protein